jgi:predicted nucleotidyltransferase component of viral defense system
MAIDIINNRIASYKTETKQAELNAIKEISQEIALAGLSRAGFFKHALFQGDTCLRIIHGLTRFSEDLDFILNERNEGFKWEPYLNAIKTEFEAFGLSLSVTDRSKTTNTLKKAFLKEDSFGKVLNLHYERTKADTQTIKIKLEIDTNPPEGSIAETHALDYPYPFPVITQDLPSLFSGKCHALLCREYVKGRDWFDFVWYMQKQTEPNYLFLKNALEQCGSYKDQAINISKAWLTEELAKKIESLNWQAAANDVKRFLPSHLAHTVETWNKDLFLAVLKKLP